MNIVLLTDRKNVLDSCSKYMSEYTDSLSVKAKIIAADSTAMFEEATETECPDIAYIDIETADSAADNIKWLEDIKKIYPRCIFAVIADNEEYTLWGYKNQIADYIVLPASEQDICQSLQRIISTNYKDIAQNISIKIRGIWTKLNTDNVVYIETSNHRINFYMSDGNVFSEKGNFNLIRNIIDCNPYLFQCHKSYAVNGKYIERMTQTAFIMTTEKSVSISRPYRVDSRVFYAQLKTL